MAKTCVITSVEEPGAAVDAGWCFHDTESGIIDAVNRGATHLWANTIPIASRSLQISEQLSQHASKLRIVGQPPRLVELHDDKNFVNDLLRKDGSFDLPRSWLVKSTDGNRQIQ